MQQGAAISNFNSLQAEYRHSFSRGLTVKPRALESIYQQKVAALEELKKSILHQAFSGE